MSDMIDTTEDVGLVEDVRDVAECPRCGGTGMVPGETGPTGDDPERPCEVCAMSGLVSEAYAHAYEGLRREKVELSNLAWLAEQARDATLATNATLRDENERLDDKLRNTEQKLKAAQKRMAELQRKYAPPADTPRGRRPLPM